MSEEEWNVTIPYPSIKSEKFSSLLSLLIICIEEVGKSYQKPSSATWMPTAENNQGLVGCIIKYAKLCHYNALLKELYIFILLI